MVKDLETKSALLLLAARVEEDDALLPNEEVPGVLLSLDDFGKGVEVEVDWFGLIEDGLLVVVNGVDG